MQITSDMLTTMNDAYRANPVMKAAALAMGHQPLNEVVFNCENAAKGRFLFNHEVETMKVTNQKSSGRCWLFAALNLFREIAAKKMNVEFFELSQNFIAYYDKLEKANYFLDSIMQTLDLPKDDRMVTYIVSTGIQDGGQWDMFANIVEKYGVVPTDVYDETFQSCHTANIFRICSYNAAVVGAVFQHTLVAIISNLTDNTTNLFFFTATGSYICIVVTVHNLCIFCISGNSTKEASVTFNRSLYSQVLHLCVFG